MNKIYRQTCHSTSERTITSPEQFAYQINTCVCPTLCIIVWARHVCVCDSTAPGPVAVEPPRYWQHLADTIRTSKNRHARAVRECVTDMFGEFSARSPNWRCGLRRRTPARASVCLCCRWRDLRDWLRHRVVERASLTFTAVRWRLGWRHAHFYFGWAIIVTWAMLGRDRWPLGGAGSGVFTRGGGAGSCLVERYIRWGINLLMICF